MPAGSLAPEDREGASVRALPPAEFVAPSHRDFDNRGRDVEAELLQLAGDAGRAPERLGRVHLPDQRADVGGHTWPARRGRDFNDQYSPNPRRCQRTTVSGVTIWMAPRQFCHSRDSSTHGKRSARPGRGGPGAWRWRRRVMPESKALRLELETRPNERPEGGDQGDEQRGHAPAVSIAARNGNEHNRYRSFW